MDCLEYIKSLSKNHESLFSRIRELAYRAAKKLNVDDWIEGMAYLQRLKKSNGRMYVVIELYRENGSRRKISLGPLEKFNKDVMYSVLKERFGLSEDEVNALLMLRFLKDYQRLLDRFKYHIERALELSTDLEKFDVDRAIDDLVEQVKAVEVIVWK